MLTRDRAIQGLAKRLATRDGYTWQVAPVGAQSAKQANYVKTATIAVCFIESAMKDWQWANEDTAPAL